MTTYSTQNPIGSTDPRDLYDNAENLDNLVNGEQPSYDDRLGKSRRSWQSVEDQVNQQEAEFNADQSSRNNQFQSAQSSREAVFSNFLQASGYQDLGEYALGIEITAHNQYVTFGGQPYLLKPSIPVPYTTSGEWTGEDFKLIGDHSLRQDLANPNKGAAMVARGVVAVDNIADLLALPEDQRREDLRYLVKGYHAGSDVGGGEFVWDPLSTSIDDGGTVLSIEGIPTGRFKRIFDGYLYLTWFGAVGDGITNSTIYVQNAVNCAQATNNKLYVPSGIYRIEPISVNRDNGKSPLVIQGDCDRGDMTTFRTMGKQDVLFMLSGRGHRFIDLNMSGAIDGNRLAGCAIYSDFSPSTTLINVSASGFNKYGLLYLNDSWSSRIEGCTSAYNDGFGLVLAGECHNTNLSKCYFGLNNGFGLFLHRSSGVSLVSCGFENNLDGALYLNRGYNTSLHGSYFEGNGTRAVTLTDVDGNNPFVVNTNIIISAGYFFDLENLIKNQKGTYYIREDITTSATSIVSSTVTNNSGEGIPDISFIEALSADGLNVTDVRGSGDARSVGVRTYLRPRSGNAGAFAGQVNVGRMIGYADNITEVYLTGSNYTSLEGIVAAKSRFEIPQINEMSKEDLTLFDYDTALGSSVPLEISETVKSYHSKSVYKVSATAPTNESNTQVFGKIFPVGNFPSLNGKVVYLTLKYISYGSATAVPVARNNTLGTEPRYPGGFTPTPGEVYTTPPVFFKYDSSLSLRVGLMLTNVMDFNTDYVEILDMVLAPVGVDVRNV
ncbi:MAG: right-handed parallel beta-helix repeat-containing protein [Candidatus Methanomethylicaceae archaeon]